MTVPAAWLQISALHGERLLLEPLRVDHAVEMAPLLDDPLLHTYIGGEPPTADELRDQYARQSAGRSTDGTERWLNWIIRRRDDNQVVGYVQATATVPLNTAPSDTVPLNTVPSNTPPGGRSTADVAWVIGSQSQGRGYAMEAARLMVDWLRSEGVLTITAHIHPDHAASGAVARRIGLQPTREVVDDEIRWEG